MNMNIRKAREAAGLSQKQVALELRVSAPTVSDWESGKMNPSAANLKELSKLYNASIDYLLGLTSERCYSSGTSKRICKEIATMHKESPDRFSHFIIPNEIWNQIHEGTYQFSDVTFPQFAEILNKTIEDFIEPYDEHALKSAFFGGYDDTLTADEVDELWEDAKDYFRYKIDKRKKTKE